MKYLALSLLVLAGTVNADCHVRVATKLSSKAVFGQPTDIQRMVVPDAKGYQCVVRYRLNLNLDWQTIEGTAVGKTETQACSEAYTTSKVSILKDIVPQSITSDQQMVCSDLPDIRVRPVRIGEIIWESETDIHSIPAERPYFIYKNSQCRMFVERASNDKNFFTHQGIICRLNATRDSKWQVVDKY